MPDDLPTLIQRALSAGIKADEIVLRVSSYGPGMTAPIEFQAIVRFRDRGKPWGVAVHSDPAEAMTQALLRALEIATPPAASPALPRVRQRMRPSA